MAAKKKTARKKDAARGKGKAKGKAKNLAKKSAKRASAKPSGKTTSTGIVYRDVLHEALAARLGRL
jgi:hypothetical protein